MGNTLTAILAIDQGTTGSTAVLYNPSNWAVLGRANVEFLQLFPQPGFVEHDPEEIWKSVLDAINQAFASAQSKLPFQTKIKLHSIGVTNQRETVVCFDRFTGKPLANAIVWQDRRTASLCRNIRASEKICQYLQHTTGLVPDPYFSATKITWLLSNHVHIQKAVQDGTAVFGTIDAFLIHRLTGRKEFLTDATNASRTMLVNLETNTYDPELMSYFGIPESSLAQIKPSISHFGFTKEVPGLDDGIPIEGVLGDQQAALFGQQALLPGEAKVTYGTGAFLLMNTGLKIIRSKQGLLTSIALKTATQTSYCLEGSCFIAGAAVQFLRDGLKFFSSSKDSESLAMSEPGDEFLEFVPSLAGLSAPFWNPDAKGVFFGLTRGSSQAQLTRAVLESIALQNVPLLKLMQQESSLALSWLGVDGGAAANNYLMQFQADMLQTTLRRAKNLEATSLGAARAAEALRGEFTKAQDKGTSAETESDRFVPKMDPKMAQKRYQRWFKAAQAVDRFYSEP